QLLRRADRLGLTNLRVVCGDAVEVLRRAFRSSSIDEILILFPDPWHKKRHHKRRLILADFAALLADRLAAGGRLWIATDWQPYADHMLAVLNATPGLRNLAGGGFAPRPSWREPTRFEQRGARLGHRVWDLAYEKAARIPSSTN
ncbi:MAG: tRNA (guanosine(46)-N7)-methyltransferase TrmB, partial [Steroidobacteraceae bacterium]|nr:tRNA (guanosine(46)-N7)-methyltransferase TrmB [Steroidobacteraceae bacterium]